MTDKEFENLQIKLEKKILEVHRLQDIHNQETGKDFVLGQPIISGKKGY